MVGGPVIKGMNGGRRTGQQMTSLSLVGELGSGSGVGFGGDGDEREAGGRLYVAGRWW